LAGEGIKLNVKCKSLNLKFKSSANQLFMAHFSPSRKAAMSSNCSSYFFISLSSEENEMTAIPALTLL
jgi:hypothetical protein